MTNTTTTASAAWRPDKVAELPLNEGLPNLFLHRLSTFAGECDGDADRVRVPYVSADPTAATFAEAAAITASDAALDEIVISTTKTAALSVISSEVYFVEGNARRIATSLARAVTAKANDQFVGALAALSDGMADGGELGANLDTLTDAMATIEANGADPDELHLVMSATTWATLSKIKTATGSNAPLLGVGQNSTEGVRRSIFGAPVTLSAAASAAIYVVSKPDLLSAYSSVEIAKSEDAYFAQDAIGARAKFRWGIAPVEADRHAVITLGG